MKPKPIHTETVCSICGLDWNRHTEQSVAECVELLKADLAREKQRTTPQPALPYPVPYPYPVAPRRPWLPYGNQPIWISQPQTICETNSSSRAHSPQTLSWNTSGGVYQ